MAFLPAYFDATQVAPATELGAIPAGEYTVAITDSALEWTKNGVGQFLKLVFTVLEGEHKGAKVFDRLNLVNPNQTTVEIAQRVLSAICHAVGVLTLTDSSQLHDKPLKIKVSYEAAKGEFNEQNRVKAYKSLTAASTPAPTAAAKGRSAPAATTPTPTTAAPAPAPAAATTTPPTSTAAPASAPGKTPGWRQVQARQERQIKEEAQTDDIPTAATA